MKRIPLLTAITLLTGVATMAAPHRVYHLDLNNPKTSVSYNNEDYWDQTYNSSAAWQSVEFRDYSGEITFQFSHCNSSFGGSDVGGGMSYWDGFTFSRSGDTRDYGSESGSDGWVSHQWGCMAGGGLATDENGEPLRDTAGALKSEAHTPYAVAFWSRQDTCCRITLSAEDESSLSADKLYVCAHPWPYYGILHGDGFSRPFTEEDDYMSLTIHGIGADGSPNGKSVEYMLATMFDPTHRGNYAPLQSPNWEEIDISPLGDISGVYFTMDSSDSDPTFGMNNAAYFCVGGMSVKSNKEDVTGITDVAESTEESTTWHTLSGLPIEAPTAPGIYIKRRGNHAEKIMVR